MLPSRVRWMAGMCAVVCALTMWGATSDFFKGLQIEAWKTDLGSSSPKSYIEDLGLQVARAEVAHYGTIRGPRMLVSLLLSLAAGLGFASALRILKPRGIRREGMRILLMRSVFFTALLRTIVGAAEAGASSYSGRTLKRIEPTLPGKEEWLATFPAENRNAVQEGMAYFVDHYASFSVGASIVWTLFLTMIFVAFWRYFSRDEVKNLLAVADEAPPSA